MFLLEINGMLPFLELDRGGEMIGDRWGEKRLDGGLWG